MCKSLGYTAHPRSVEEAAYAFPLPRSSLGMICSRPVRTQTSQSQNDLNKLHACHMYWPFLVVMFLCQSKLDVHHADAASLSFWDPQKVGFSLSKVCRAILLQEHDIRLADSNLLRLQCDGQSNHSAANMASLNTQAAARAILHRRYAWEAYRLLAGSRKFLPLGAPPASCLALSAGLMGAAAS